MSYQSAESVRERMEAAYIGAYGERMAQTIAETWADAIILHESRNRERRREVIVGAIVEAINKNMSELEIAETAADLCGNPDYEEFSK